MTEFIPSEKGTPIRFPSTANLYIDSLDRDTDVPVDGDGFLTRTAQSSTNFLINRPQNILTGFFTRLALNEVVLDWGVPNIISGVNNEFIVRSGVTNTSVLLDTGFYTVAECVTAITAALNTALGVGTYSLVANTRGVALTKTTGSFAIISTPLALQLNCLVSSSGGLWTFGTSFTFFSPVLLNQKYIDIVSPQLTYNQDLKDASTATYVRDVIYRWYFGWDGETLYDTYDYPILQGYRAFLQRRSIAFPKQIKWDNIQPIGQISFQVYDDAGDILNVPPKNPLVLGNFSRGELEFNLSFLVSEV
jgi:hypothetical protein